ncbi:heterokaryon incompatibility protein-domain-containing protein [Rhexocercosporidium sp. MPI-PUGE-AT-0058]|nr:heterokaryon incompatibility protein-domain-containing protein [Rhexocercosporidium sp. MPI-PUGE-AT-0058]
MRLLNTTTLLLEEFFGDKIPSYAILSHRWEGEQVTFQDLREGLGVNMAGYSKIIGCCRQAKLDGWKYTWIDSCCIDKSSSSELSEAINSMFRWYRDAEVCYVYLSDADPFRSMWDSEWWKRGWTLQELLAPEFLIFYDEVWNELGTKHCLKEAIEKKTGVADLMDFECASIAQKMSWASNRNTTRTEDLAYCLMGLFGVNMSPLYGEGANAFLRLQLEIIRISDDESIFAWKPQRWGTSGLLAQSITDFSGSGDITVPKLMSHRAPYAMTNKGMEIEALLMPSRISTIPSSGGSSSKYYMQLNCIRQGDERQLSITVKGAGNNQFVRILPGNLVARGQFDGNGMADLPDVASLGGVSQICYFKQEKEEMRIPFGCFQVKLSPESERGYHLAGVMTDSREQWSTVEDDFASISIYPSRITDEAAILVSYGSAKHPFAILLRMQNRHPMVHIVCKKSNRLPGDAEWTQRGTSHFDKSTQSLESGDSVSYTLRNCGRMAEDNGGKRYTVDIKIRSQKGSLPWTGPEPGAAQPCIPTPMERICQRVIEGSMDAIGL